jgi:hypothetical protein
MEKWFMAGYLLTSSVVVITWMNAKVSRFEALLPHRQLRLTFGEMQLPIIH